MPRDAEKLKRWREANRERSREQERARYWKDPEKHREKVRKQRQNMSPEKARARRLRDNLKKTYGLTVDAYEAMVRRQDNKCAICGGPPFGNGNRLYVDHDHRNGRVRELLCHGCNVGIGCFYEDTRKLEAAIAYLRKHAG
jgi:hypothetical protein